MFNSLYHRFGYCFYQVFPLRSKDPSTGNNNPCSHYKIVEHLRNNIQFPNWLAGNVNTLRNCPYIDVYRFRKGDRKLMKFLQAKVAAPFRKYSSNVTGCESGNIYIYIYIYIYITNPQQRLEIFLFTTTSRLALGPNQTAIHWVLGALSLGLKRPGSESDHSPPSSPEVKEYVKLYLHSPIHLHGVVLS
jgi:hypothetical protein